MSPRPVPRCSRFAAAALTGIALATAAGAAPKTIAPQRVELDVHWGGGAGSDAFRDDLRRVLSQTLATRCFAGVTIADGEPAEPGSELVFEVVLSNVLDETRFDDSISAALEPGEPAKELRRVANFEVTVDAALTARAHGALVNRKHMIAHVSRRPVYVGEDPQAVAHEEAIDDIVKALTRALDCGSDKLARKIQAALGGSTPPAPKPR